MNKEEISSLLLASDFIYDHNLSIWIEKDQQAFDYNDGDDHENYILDVVTKANDCSVLSQELAGYIKDWPSQYHLTSKRSNLLRPFAKDFKGKRVLEIGCGCGAITRFIGEAGAEVTAVEGSIRRAAITRNRCKDLEKVTVISSSSDKLPDIGEFDYVLLIGVLEYAQCFLGSNGQLALLTSCKERLKADGSLFVAIENQLGMKYLSGAKEDHLGIPMVGINDAYHLNGARTFGRVELTQMMQSVGFSNVEEFLPFPDYKLPTLLITPYGHQKHSSVIYPLVTEVHHKDAQAPDSYTFSLEKSTKIIWKNNLSADLANSFLMIASATSKHHESENVLAWYYSDSRLNGSHKKIKFTEKHGNFNTECYKISGEFINERPFYQGESLWLSLVSIINKHGWHFDDLIEWVKLWISQVLITKNASWTWDTELPAEFLDATPFNIIKTEQGYEIFDLELKFDKPLLLSYLVFRGVFNSLLRVTSVAPTKELPDGNILTLTKKVVSNIFPQLTDEHFSDFLKQEVSLVEKVVNVDTNDLFERYKNSFFVVRDFLNDYKAELTRIYNINENLIATVMNFENKIKVGENQIKDKEEEIFGKDALLDIKKKELIESQISSSRQQVKVKDLLNLTLKIYRFAKKMLSSGDRDLLKYRIKLASGIYKEDGFKAVYNRLQSAYKNNLVVYAYNPESSINVEENGSKDRASLVEEWLKTDFKKSLLKVNEQNHYVPKSLDSLEHVELPVKVIAYYLPQFYPFKENNEWWGDGFTEWTNVTKARPQYLGHQQPRLPGELGFYDLRLLEVMRQQIELAKQYGVNGFCFHHYWFGGKRLMEIPVQNFLRDKTLDINFCLCWANENWTRRWDGLENDVLIAQNHSPEDDIAFLDDIIPALKDERYIRVDGKPLLILYRASSLPDAKETGKRWRAHAVKNGLPGLYLVLVNAFDVSSPKPYDFDAIVEFPPHQIGAKDITDTVTPLNKDFSGRVYDYEELALRAGKIDNENFTCFKAVMPSWDNEARKPTQGFSFYNAKPELYAKWLDSAIKTTMKRRPEERLVFVNAWNEWAEGAHLEPDRHNGYAYLHATSNVLRNSLFKYDCDNQLISEINKEFKARFQSAVILHAYYEDLSCELVDKYISQHQDKLDLIITMRRDVKLSTLEKIKASFPNVFFVMVDNRGRDIRPFIKSLKVADGFDYKYICKVHTKKSLHRVDGQKWCENLFDDLLISSEHASKIISHFERNENTGIIAPKNSITDLSIPEINLGNRYWLGKLFARMNAPELSKSFKTSFPAGSMFWFRKDALDPLASNLLDEEEFELEAGQLDGTLAHSVERVTGAVANAQGYKVIDITAL